MGGPMLTFVSGVEVVLVVMESVVVVESIAALGKRLGQTQGVATYGASNV